MIGKPSSNSCCSGLLVVLVENNGSCNFRSLFVVERVIGGLVKELVAFNNCIVPKSILGFCCLDFDLVVFFLSFFEATGILSFGVLLAVVILDFIVGGGCDICVFLLVVEESSVFFVVDFCFCDIDDDDFSSILVSFLLPSSTVTDPSWPLLLLTLVSLMYLEY